MSERYTEILHKRHGWIVAGAGSYFTPSKSGKTIEFHESDESYAAACAAGVPHYPFGTTFHARSIIAYA